MSESNYSKLQHIIEILEDKIEEIKEFVEDNIPSRGDIEDDCQRLRIINAIIYLERNVNDLEEKDLEPLSDDADYRLIWMLGR